MINHTVLFTPLRLATGTYGVVALLWTDNTTVTLSQSLETRVTVALIKTPVCPAVTVHTIDAAMEIQSQLPAEILVQWNLMLAQ